METWSVRETFFLANPLKYNILRKRCRKAHGTTNPLPGFVSVFTKVINN
jgi:hypothetical protein